ncbi:hypothetical protein [Dokdonia sp. Dokd-P16]|uniref:hypothetical protein n=1 Tax=Dokdonia sp. Dokd-P16 TaxID=2173169 RepID=UPI001EF321EC|nr:hypothetical protein [Dokdonia sp. Dokd-P16]
MPHYIGVFEKLAIQRSGSKEVFKAKLAERIESDGEAKATLDILFPVREWNEESIELIQQAEHMRGLNDFITGVVQTDLMNTFIDLDALFKHTHPLALVLAGFGIFEWLNTNMLSMESLEHDINMSKNTRRTWLKFFFEKPTDSLEITTKPHKFYKVRKISPKDYFHIWGKFITVDMDYFDDDFKERIAALKQGWVVSKKDLKNKYNKRSEDIKIALEDAVEQPDYPSSWPKVIPDKDKFPYSVSLFIARELSLM